MSLFLTDIVDLQKALFQEAPALQEVASPTFYIPDTAGAPPGQPSAIAYHQPPQTASYWNQPVTFYQNSTHPPTPTPPHQRYPSTQTGK